MRPNRDSSKSKVSGHSCVHVLKPISQPLRWCDRYLDDIWHVPPRQVVKLIMPGEPLRITVAGKPSEEVLLVRINRNGECHLRRCPSNSIVNREQLGRRRTT